MLHHIIYILVPVTKIGLEDLDGRVQGYICTPHHNELKGLLEIWMKSINIVNVYFVTATFSDESIPYFPYKANHYILASFLDVNAALSDVKKYNIEELSFMFNLNSELFERNGDKLNYISMYFMKYGYGTTEIGDLANVIAKRDRVRKASLANLMLITNRHLKFTFPYSKNVIVLEVEGQKTHQSDQKYCERTRREVGRKGIPLSNLVSLSVLERFK